MKTLGLLLIIAMFSTNAYSTTLEVDSAERLNLLRRAQIWNEVDIPARDLLAGPQANDSFGFNQRVRCTYVEPSQEPGPHSGSTAKFYCRDGADRLKVRCDPANGEVYASVAATRLFWALGFGAERMYPARVVCKNCPIEPGEGPNQPRDTVLVDPATIERKFANTKIILKGDPESGWSWKELSKVEESEGGASRAQIDALRLLAALVQHGDNRAAQQYLVCLDSRIEDGQDTKSACSRPFLLVHDLGATFGKSTRNIDESSKMNWKGWSSTPVWKDPRKCVAELRSASDGSFRDPRISEEGRKFLAGLLMQLSDRQIEDLFKAARADRRDPSASVQDWVDTFKRKRAEIVEHECP